MPPVSQIAYHKVMASNEFILTLIESIPTSIGRGYHDWGVCTQEWFTPRLHLIFKVIFKVLDDKFSTAFGLIQHYEILSE